LIQQLLSAAAAALQHDLPITHSFIADTGCWSDQRLPHDRATLLLLLLTDSAADRSHTDANLCCHGNDKLFPRQRQQ